MVLCLEGEAESWSSWEPLLYHTVALGERLHLHLSANPPETLPSLKRGDISLLFTVLGDAGGIITPKLKPQSFAAKVQMRESVSGHTEKLLGSLLLLLGHRRC